MDRGLLNDATSTDDSPTPGYMLSEIARATTANYQANTQLQDFCISRLAHKSHNVKWKALLVIKHVCRTGRPEFKREMARKVDPIKDCLQYRGNPDPIRGDELNKRVRDAAKEALDAIFDSQMPVTTSAVAAANRIQGMGNDYVPESKPQQSGGIISSLVSGISNTILGDGTESTYQGNHGAGGSFRSNTSAPGGYSHGGGASGNGSYGGPSGGSSGTMTGLGNPNFRDAREEKSWVQKATEAAQSAMGSSSSSSTSGKALAPGSSGYSDYNYATNRGTNAYGGNDPAYNPRSTMNAFGASTSSADWQRGGVTSTSQGGNAPSTAFGGSAPSSAFGGSMAAPVVGRAGGAASDGAYEKGLIDTLCEPGGLKAVPPENKLQEFLATTSTLDAEVVGNCLVDTLNSDQWQARVKALLVVTSVVKAANNQAHVDWWLANVNEVRALVNDTNSKVRLQAVKLVRLLDGDAGSADDNSVRSLSPKNTSYPTITSAGANGQTTGSLLDDLDEPAPLSLNPVTAPVQAAQGVNLFGDVTFTSQQQQQPQTQPYAATVSSPMAGNSNALFDGMSLGAGAAPAAPYHLSSPAAYQPTASALSSMTVTPSMTPTTMGRPAPVMNASAPAPAPPVIDSAFDFLDGMTPAPAPPAAPSAYAAPMPMAATPSIFDSFDNVPLTSTLAARQATSYNNEHTPAPVAASTSANGSAFSFLSSPSSTAPRSNPSDVISTAFLESNQKKDANDSFAQLGASFGAPSSSSSSGNGYQQQQQQQPAPRPMGYGMNMAPVSNGYPGQAAVQGGYPPQSQMSGYPPVGGMQQQAPRGVAPGGYGYNMNTSSVLAPSMLPHNAARKAIPDTSSTGNSGFSFLDSNGAAPRGAPTNNPNNHSNTDSFDFITQSMKNMNK